MILTFSDRHPVRRLVVMGKDTPDNMTLLFGPNWEAEVSEIHEEARMRVLHVPLPGSPHSIADKDLDKGTPLYSPRPASVAEKARMEEIHNAQVKILTEFPANANPSDTEIEEFFEEVLPISQSEGVEKVLNLELAVKGINLDEEASPS